MLEKPRIVARGLAFPEGPYQHPDGFLLVQESRAHRIVQIGPEGKVDTWVETPGADTGGIVFNRAGFAFVTAGDGVKQVLRITPDRKVEPFIIDHRGRPLLGPNDLAMHPSGHIFFSDPGRFATAQHNGALYRAGFDGRTVRIAADMGFPNGVAVSSDGDRVYVAETLTGLIQAFNVTPEGELRGRAVLADVGRGSGSGGPDGMCVDERGNIYVAIYSGSVVKVVAPSGQLIRDIPAGGVNPTNCCFGGPDLKTLYITEAETGTLRAVPNDIPGAPPVRP